MTASLSTSGGADRPSSSSSSSSSSSLSWSSASVASGSSTKKKLLVLMDIGGTLMHRCTAEEKVRGVRADHFMRNRKQPLIYIRPGARELIDGLLNHPNCHLAFYTSIHPHNAEEIRDVLIHHPTTRKRLFGLFAGPACSAPDPEAAESWQMKRDLNLIWRRSVCRAHGYDEHNTLVIDSEARKIRDFALNAIVMPPWTAAEVKAKIRTDPCVAALEKYIRLVVDGVATGKIVDIRLHIDGTPFVFPEPKEEEEKKKHKPSPSSSSSSSSSSSAAATPTRGAGAGTSDDGEGDEGDDGGYDDDEDDAAADEVSAALETLSVAPAPAPAPLEAKATAKTAAPAPAPTPTPTPTPTPAGAKKGATGAGAGAVSGTKGSKHKGF